LKLIKHEEFQWFVFIVEMRRGRRTRRTPALRPAAKRKTAKAKRRLGGRRAGGKGSLFSPDVFRRRSDVRLPTSRPDGFLLMDGFFFLSRKSSRASKERDRTVRLGPTLTVAVRKSQLASVLFCSVFRFEILRKMTILTMLRPSTTELPGFHSSLTYFVLHK
jgi:hypothetical protein